MPFKICFCFYLLFLCFLKKESCVSFIFDVFVLFVGCFCFVDVVVGLEFVLAVLVLWNVQPQTEEQRKPEKTDSDLNKSRKGLSRLKIFTNKINFVVSENVFKKMK